MQLIVSHVAAVFAAVAVAVLIPYVVVCVNAYRGRTQHKEAFVTAYLGFWVFVALATISVLLFAWAWA